MISAATFNLDDPDWKRNSAGRLYNHKFGYGKLDVYTLVQNAKTFKLLNPQVSIEMPIIEVNKPIPMNEEGVFSKLIVKESDIARAKMRRLEHVTVTMNVFHERRGDIEVDLISPNGIVSKIGLPRMYDEDNSGLRNWTFMSIIHWDESPIGTWFIQVRDRRNPDYNGIFVDWMLKLWGERAYNSTSNNVNNSDENFSSIITSETTVTTKSISTSQSPTKSIDVDDDNNSAPTSTILTSSNPISTETQSFTAQVLDGYNNSLVLGKESNYSQRKHIGNNQFMASNEMFDSFGDGSVDEQEQEQEDKRRIMGATSSKEKWDKNYVNI
ncbi:4597_t:CDS:2 [Entrophospora sp. SA101]|nr:4597_t:CDS:2 [Entrophospora sp. SA101]